MYYVYILISERDRSLYVGFTSNLSSRLKRHNYGYVRSTYRRRPMRLIYFEAYLAESDARRREIYLKGGKAKNEFKTQLRDTYKKVEYKYLSA
jgi:putative endonuclease